MPDRIGYSTSEEAEERVRDRRGEDREGRQKGGLGRPVSHIGQGDERDRVPETADRLTHPKEGEVGRAKLASPRSGGSRLKPQEGDQKATEADEEVAEAENRPDRGDRDDVREEFESRGRPEGNMEAVIRRLRCDRRDHGGVVRHPRVEDRDNQIEERPKGQENGTRHTPVPGGHKSDAEERDEVKLERRRRDDCSDRAERERDHKYWPELQGEGRKATPISTECDACEDPCRYSTSQHERRGPRVR